MTVVLLLLLAGLQSGSPDPFDVQSDLQGIYDELSQAAMQFATPADIDSFHNVFYAPDWVFIDAAGQRHSWTEMREHDVQALSGPRADSIQQPIRKLSLVPDGATVTTNVTTVRTIVDEEGRYGRKGATHTLTESTVFRDAWVKSGESWKLKSREQVGKPTVSVDHSPSLM
jgi:hypothetical protein